MAKRGTDKPVYAYLRRGNYLVPEMEYDLSALENVAQGQRVRLEILQWRNNDRLRAYWAMLNEMVAATGCAPNSKVLHQTIKLETGHVERARLGDGRLIEVPSSVALDAMSEDDFVTFFRAAEEFLALNYGYVKEERRRRA